MKAKDLEPTIDTVGFQYITFEDAKNMKFEDANGNLLEFQDCGDGETFVSKDILFLSEFEKDITKNNVNAFEGSDIQIALEKWFDENAPEKIKAEFDIDLLTMTEIFGETRESGSNKFWPDEPYIQLPLFKDWKNRTKVEVNGNCPKWWWTKSPCAGDTKFVCIVDSHGGAHIAYVYGSLGVVPCLRRKAK